MDRATQIDHLRADSARLLTAHRDDPHAPARAGLAWDRTDLLAHVTGVHAWVRMQLEEGPERRVRFGEVAPPPEGDALPVAFEQGVAALATLLEDMDVEATWPTWAGPLPGSFFPRRMAQETTIHRWDAVGGEVDADLGVDGVTELLERFAPRLPADRFAGVDGTIHLHAVDVEGEWLVQLGPESVTFERGHAKGDVALRGSAGDLLLWAWNRVSVDERFEVFGDAALLDEWRARVVF